jgi:hypothetical protein
VPHDAATAERVRALLPGAVEKRMVGGGLSSSAGGSTVCGVTATALAVRVGADADLDRWLRRGLAFTSRLGRP